MDTQTILTIATHVITKNHRIAVTHSDHRLWFLHIREVREADRGWYMCQINTDPMLSQVGYLEVVGEDFSFEKKKYLLTKGETSKDFSTFYLIFFFKTLKFQTAQIH